MCIFLGNFHNSGKVKRSFSMSNGKIRWKQEYHAMHEYSKHTCSVQPLFDKAFILQDPELCA